MTGASSLPGVHVSSFARPELLATPEWLAENLGRPDLRVLDVRWRTDSSATTLYGTGHVPGAIDWRDAVAQVADGGTAFLLAAADRIAAAMSAAGVGDGTSVVVYDDTLGYYASRVWWSLRAYGFDAVRVLEGGWPGWVTAGQPVSTDVPQITPASFAPRAQMRLRLSIGDVRALLGSPEV
jgi:thiosulfate/3-mercaptopyruvate sulfurtransferase